MIRVLISGAGIAGPALAYWLLRSGVQPTLIERAPRFRDGGYMIDLWGVGYDMLEQMGLLEIARRGGYTIDRLVLVNEKGREISGFGANVFSEAFRGRFFSIPRGDLARLIFERVERDVDTQYSTSITALAQDPDGVEVVLSNGRVGRWDLVVGADGIHSRVREWMFGPSAPFERYLGYCGAAFSTEGYPHRDADAYVTFARPGRQISRYSLRDGRTAFLMVFARDEVPTMAPHDTGVHKLLIHERFGADGWECPEILACLDRTDDVYFDTVTQISVPTWSGGRLVLLGDAAYCPSLIAGAGAAFAMLGAYVLAGELRRAGWQHRSAFQAYERRLHPFMAAQQRSAARFARSFAPRTSLGLHARNLVLRLMHVRPLGVWYARRMFGSRLEVPDYS